ncbi:AAA domain-containing protein [Halomicroarcula sp. S1AR25-4]|uniref:AAA domain-containing protein n=1 Tax=Haloarcula sp. S1AR25-4 TaxID=2950538 RepID=UPI0028745FCD|nr:AAA domain-containing protein [Halomicroarcula sp. S1AR25-4]MDS0276409.1 AAA domain-containing protein [Halomicroarcula sp. S1AR25-4]
MQLRGPVVEVSDPKTVNTQYGESDLCEVTLRPDRGAGVPTTVTLWGKWTETADVLEPGMELAVYDPDERQYQGETQYSVGSDATVVVEPDFLVDVTDVRAWVQCPRMYYLRKLDGADLAYPLVKGTVVHEVFGDLLRGRDVEAAIDDQIEAAGLDIGLLGREADEVAGDVRDHAKAIEGWLQQGTLTDEDSAATAADSSERDFSPAESEWRSEMTLISERYGMKGRADAVRRGMPVELKTGKNTKREPRFQDKIQATAYALMLGERAANSLDASAVMAGDGGTTTPIEAAPDTGTLLYTKNAAVDRSEESGDLSPAKEFSIGSGLLNYVIRTRNAIAAMEHDTGVPTGYEANAKCEYCFEQDTCMAVSGRLDQESKAGQVGVAIPEAERDYFERFYTAIEAERRAVHREYAKLWEQTAEERAADDRALVDLEPVGRTELDSGRWELRARGTGAVSKIREGDLVMASDGDPVTGDAELARVERIGEARTASEDANGETVSSGEEIVVTADEPLDLRRLDIYPSELTTDRLQNALHDALLTQPPEQKDVLFGRRDPEFETVAETFIDNNEAQNEAVQLAVGAEDFALVHGPPGTGKTYTLARMVRALVDRGDRVLLSAFTNRAVDNAIEALEEQGFTDIVRVGTESGVREDMQNYRLEQSGDPGECAATLQNAQVVAATTATCGGTAMQSQSFDVAVVDEAGQLTEPGTLAATTLADRFALVGDHQQLPPVVQSEDATLSTSLFQRLIETHPDAGVMLDRQYRMAQHIQAFASREFYDGQLRPATGEVAGQRIDDLPGVSMDALPEHLRDRVSFVDPGGTQTGNTNPVEADAVAEVVAAYREAGVPAADVGVIAPFRAQVAELDRRLPDVAVDTVDRFQGSSKEVIVVSFVATETLEGPIFEDYRRINVAMTRAKKALVLVGDADALGTDEVYGRLVEWAES